MHNSQPKKKDHNIRQQCMVLFPVPSRGSFPTARSKNLGRTKNDSYIPNWERYLIVYFLYGDRNILETLCALNIPEYSNQCLSKILRIHPQCDVNHPCPSPHFLLWISIIPEKTRQECFMRNVMSL